MHLQRKVTEEGLWWSCAPLDVPTIDVRGGGRFLVDAWVGRRIRLFASYDVSSAFDFAPEITGYKSLRLAVTGVY